MSSWNDLPFEIRCLIADEVLVDTVVSSCEERSVRYDIHKKYARETTVFEVFHDLVDVSWHPPWVESGRQLLQLAFDETLESIRNFFVVAPEAKNYIEHGLIQRNVVESNGKWLKLCAAGTHTAARQMQKDLFLRLHMWSKEQEK